MASLDPVQRGPSGAFAGWAGCRWAIEVDNATTARWAAAGMSVVDRPPCASGRRNKFTGDRPCLVGREECRDERDFRSVHHSTDGIAARRVGSEVLTLGLVWRYAELFGARRNQARRALGPGRAGMDAVDRDPVPTQLHGQRLGHMHHGGVARTAAKIAGVAGVGARDVDDTAPTLLLHEWNDGA